MFESHRPSKGLELNLYMKNRIDKNKKKTKKCNYLLKR